MDNLAVIIEDDNFVANLYRSYLLENDFEVVIFNSSKGLKEFLEDNEVKLIIADFHLPGDSGLSILSSIKKNIPKILVSGDPFALENSPYLTIDKPIDEVSFLDEVDKLLKK